MAFWWSHGWQVHTSCQLQPQPQPQPQKEAPPLKPKPLDEAPLKKQPQPPMRVEAPAPAPAKVTAGGQQEKTYEVKGTEVTTTDTLRLQALEVVGENMEFSGDASGIFTASASPLRRARLRTKDLQALASRGTLFYFDFRPTRFEVRFYDPNDRATPLGVLFADALAPAGNPGCGAGNWSISF